VFSEKGISILDEETTTSLRLCWVGIESCWAFNKYTDKIDIKNRGFIWVGA